LHPAGPQAARIERLWWLIFWVAVAVFVAVIAVLSGAVGRSRARTTEMPPPLLDTSASDRKATRIIGVAVAITVIVLFVLLVDSVIAGKNETQSLVSKNPVVL
jgi:heme/copper-type cytochrome/quinol oxidase subunit 2